MAAQQTLDIMISGHDSNTDSNFVTRIMCILLFCQGASKKAERKKKFKSLLILYSWPDLVNQYSIFYIIIYMGPYIHFSSMLHRSIEHPPKPYRPNRQVARALGPLKQSSKPSSSALIRTDGGYLDIARSGKPKTHPDLSGMNSTDRSMSACCSS